MMRTQLGLAFAAVLLVLISWILWVLVAAEPIPEPRSGTTEESVKHELTVPAHAPQATAETVMREDVAVPEVEESPAGTRNQRKYSGTVIVTLEDGTEDPKASGTLTLIVFEDGIGVHERAELVDGRWSISGQAVDRGVPNSKLSLLECTIGDVPMQVEGGGFELPQTGPFEFRVRPIPIASLRVIAADSGKDLTGVTVLTGTGLNNDRNAHPGDFATKTITTEGRSPIQLPASDPQHLADSTFWVIAPGFAWQRVMVNRSTGGEGLARLERCGSLECWVVGDKLPAGSCLRLYGKGPRSLYGEFKPTPGQAQQIDGILPGEYQVRIEKGDWFRDPLRLAEASVTIVAGREVRVELTGKRAKAPARVNGAITVHLPSSWHGVDRLRLSIQPEGAVERWDDGWKSVDRNGMTPTGRTCEFRASLKKLFVGRYMIVVSPSEYRQLIELKDGAPNEFAINVPEAGEVEVRVVDDGTGQPILIDGLTWVGPMPDGVSGWSPESEQFDDGVARFQAPIGEIKLSMSADGYAHVWGEARRVGSGRNEFTIRLVSSCGIRIALKDGETDVPMPSFSHFSLKAKGHAGRSTTSSTAWSNVSAPGVYELTIKSVSGFESIPMRVVTIPKGEMLDLVIALVRK